MVLYQGSFILTLIILMNGSTLDVWVEGALGFDRERERAREREQGQDQQHFHLEPICHSPNPPPPPPSPPFPPEGLQGKTVLAWSLKSSTSPHKQVGEDPLPVLLYRGQRQKASRPSVIV